MNNIWNQLIKAYPHEKNNLSLYNCLQRLALGKTFLLTLRRAILLKNAGHQAPLLAQGICQLAQHEAEFTELNIEALAQGLGFIDQLIPTLIKLSCEAPSLMNQENLHLLLQEKENCEKIIGFLQQRDELIKALPPIASMIQFTDQHWPYFVHVMNQLRKHNPMLLTTPNIQKLISSSKYLEPLAAIFEMLTQDQKNMLLNAQIFSLALSQKEQSTALAVCLHMAFEEAPSLKNMSDLFLLIQVGQDLPEFSAAAVLLKKCSPQFPLYQLYNARSSIEDFYVTLKSCLSQGYLPTPAELSSMLEAQENVSQYAHNMLLRSQQSSQDRQIKAISESLPRIELMKFVQCLYRLDPDLDVLEIAHNIEKQNLPTTPLLNAIQALRDNKVIPSQISCSPIPAREHNPLLLLLSQKPARVEKKNWPKPDSHSVAPCFSKGSRL